MLCGLTYTTTGTNWFNSCVSIANKIACALFKKKWSPGSIRTIKAAVVCFCQAVRSMATDETVLAVGN